MMIAWSWFLYIAIFTATITAQKETTITKQQNEIESTPQVLKPKSSVSLFNTRNFNEEINKKTVPHKRQSQENLPILLRSYVPMIKNFKTNASKIMNFTKTTIHPKRTNPHYKKVLKTRRRLKKTTKKKSMRSNKIIVKNKKKTPMLRKRTTAFNKIGNLNKGHKPKSKKNKLNLPKTRLLKARKGKENRKRNLKRKSRPSRQSHKPRGGNRPIRRILKQQTLDSSIDEDTTSTMSLVYLRTLSGPLKTKKPY